MKSLGIHEVVTSEIQDTKKKPECRNFYTIWIILYLVKYLFANKIRIP